MAGWFGSRSLLRVGLLGVESSDWSKVAVLLGSERPSVRWMLWVNTVAVKLSAIPSNFNPV